MNFEEVDRYYTELVNRQQKEIETIKERTVTLNLSDADCDRLTRKCGESGLTIGKLLENFVGDLVDGTYSNGSDERMYAGEWFDRCWFSLETKETLLCNLLDRGYDPEDYLDTLDSIKTAQKEKKYLEDHPEEADEDSQYIDDNIAMWEEELKDMREDWKPVDTPDLDEEVAIIQKWLEDRNKLLYGTE